MRSEPEDITLSAGGLDLVILDLDGVITRTARVHATAWKQVFDRLLARRKPEDPPFDATADYLRYVDGKPRYDGVESFLASRGISLPFGDPSDAPGEKTVCAVGNAKDALFHELLKEGGVEVYDDAVRFIETAREHGLKLAVISSSRNCRAVLEAAGLEHLFDIRVDGLEMARLGLEGKPAPDIFLEAAKRLGVEPARAVVIEDALAGVEAGRAGGFAHVIGVDRVGQRGELERHGADMVVPDLARISIVGNGSTGHARALEALDTIGELIGQRPVAFFLDYDGTLTPIVERPELAKLAPEMRGVLADLAGLATVAIVSGRSLEDVRRLVGLDSVAYAGAHGFDILGPEGRHIRFTRGEEFVPDIEAAERLLRERLGDIRGALVETKRYSLAIHYRLVGEPDMGRVEQAVEAALAALPRLKRTEGKKVYELRPDIDWDKGKALWWIYRALGLEDEGALPVYIGDDVTDYDAFEALADDGIGILVSESPPATPARYVLRDPAEVADFLNAMINLLRSRTA